MKKIILFILVASAVSCKNTSQKETRKNEVATNETTVEKPSYPYSIKNPDNWSIGSTANTMVALTLLKKWEEGKMDESAAYFADTINLKFDGLDKNMPRDSVKNMLGGWWNSYKAVDIKMEDWESVISKDKSEEWVTIWYTEHWETKNGVKDSAAMVNDFKLSNGKIVKLDEYTRKLH